MSLPSTEALHSQLNQLVLLTNGIDIFSKIYVIFANGHTYFQAWKDITFEIGFISDLINLVRRFEGTFQLKGLGIWLLNMILTSCQDNEGLKILSSDATLELLLRISLEFNAQDKCYRYFRLCFDRKLINFGRFFDIVISISDQLPTPVKYGIFMDFFKFSFVAIQLDAEATPKVLSALLFIIPRVEMSSKANYFVSDIWYATLCGHLRFDSLSALQLSALIYKFLAALCFLHATHSLELHDLGIVQTVIARLQAATPNYESYADVALVTAMLQFVAAAGQDPTVQCLLRESIGVDSLTRFVIPDSLPPLTVDQSIYDCSLPACALNCERLEAIVSLFHVVHRSDSADLESNAALLHLCLSEFLRILEQQNKSPELHELEVGSHSDDPIVLMSMGSTAIEGIGHGHIDPLQYSSIANNSQVQKSVCVAIKNLSRFCVFSVFPSCQILVDKLRQHFVARLEELPSIGFVGSGLFYVGALITICGSRSFCWIPDNFQEDFELLAHAELVKHVVEFTSSDSNDSKRVSRLVGNHNDISKSSAVLTSYDTNELRIPTSATVVNVESTARQRSRSFDSVSNAHSQLIDTLDSSNSSKANVENSAVKYVGIRLFMQHEASLKETLSDWAIVPTGTLFYHLALILSIGITSGFGFLEPLVDVTEFGEMLMEIITDDRLGLVQYPGMLEKCLRLLTFIARESIIIEPGLEFGKCQVLHQLPFATSLCDYILGLFSSEEFYSYDDNFLFQCLSLLIAISPYDRQCRRTIVKSFAKIHHIFIRLGAFIALAPLLKLISRIRDCIGKIDASDNEGVESLLSILVSSLRMHACGRYDLALFACQTIADIGGEYPGLAHRIFMRREIEDLLALFLEKASREEFSPFKENQKILVVLKACIVCVKDVNPNPFWQYTTFGYHWSAYAEGISARKLIGPRIIQLLANFCTNSDANYRLLIVTSCLEYSTALMFNCCDGNFSRPFVGLAPDKIVDHAAFVKTELIKKFLPIIPKALNIIISRDNSKVISVSKPAPSNQVIASGMTEMTEKILESNSPIESANETGDETNDQGRAAETRDIEDVEDTNENQKKKKGLMKSMKSSLRGTLGLISKKLQTSVEPRSSTTNNADDQLVADGASAKERRKSTLRATKELFQTITKQNKAVAAPSTYRNSVTSIRPSLYRSWAATSESTVNRALESLTEKTVEAMFAFLCLEDMFPLSTYLMNVSLFERTPICACLAYSMSSYPENLLIQQRGIEIFRTFAENKIELSSLGMHASTALLTALKKFDDHTKLQLSFCKVIKILAASDDFARDNLIRYSVQDGLSSLLRKSNFECALNALEALRGLANSPAEARFLCEGSDVVPSIVCALESFSSDLKIHIEGLRTLICVSDAVEFVETMQSAAAEATLRKSRKLLQAAIKVQKFPAGYSAEDVQSVLDDPQLAALTDQCIIS